MTNCLIYKYVIDRRLPLLLGIKEEEIIAMRTWDYSVYFKRNNIKYYVKIKKGDEGLNLSLERDFSTDKHVVHPVTLVRCEGITNEAGFEKFRILLTEVLQPIKAINCNEEKE